MTLLNMLKVLNVLNLLNVPNVPKDASLASLIDRFPSAEGAALPGPDGFSDKIQHFFFYNSSF